ncbi:uncharacterized protein LOC131684238 [Topomyia yanbarensis]|uniref:uncharacterized protein LOC131684238 n=1 Tax=Topomyia yanbarensis TaxID=2498891 RepID=UPI00273A996C|nr:uncharacterized protein LOC131684238 [Topomyia yanbarensis]
MDIFPETVHPNTVSISNGNPSPRERLLPGWSSWYASPPTTMSMSDGIWNLGSANDNLGRFHVEMSIGAVGRLTVGLLRIRNSSLVEYGVDFDLILAVNWHLICLVDSPIPATAISTLVRRRFREFASLLVIKLHMDPESNSARTGISLPFWSTTRRQTVSSKTVLCSAWADRLTWLFGFIELEGPAMADVEGRGWLAATTGVDCMFDGTGSCSREWCFSWQLRQENTEVQFLAWCPVRKQFQHRRFWETSSRRWQMDISENAGH